MHLKWGTEVCSKTDRQVACIPIVGVGIMLPCSEFVLTICVMLCPMSFAESVFCTANNYPCLGSAKHCIPPGLVCNDAKDCPLGDDEFFCSK